MTVPEPRHLSRIGRYETTSVAGEKVSAFIPPSLRVLAFRPRSKGHKWHLADWMAWPPSCPIPDCSCTGLFLYMCVRKEAVLSSQIEGTQSSLSDLLLFESEAAPGVSIDEVAEVSCYVAAPTL